MPTILVVDDQREMIDLMVTWLKPRRYEVLGATSGEEALRLAALHLPDLILLDVMMPDPNGIEVCRRLRSSAQFGHIPVVLFTAYDPAVGRVEALMAGASDYITKPIELDDLDRRIRSLLMHDEGLLDQGQRIMDETVHAALSIVPCNLAWLLVSDPRRLLLVGQAAAASQGAGIARHFLQHVSRGKPEFTIPLEPQCGVLPRVALSGVAEFNLPLSALRDDGDQVIYEACASLDLYFVTILPVHLAGVPLGVLLLGTRDPRDVETPRGQQVMATVTSQAAMAVRNLQLMQTLERREAEEARSRAFWQAVLDTMGDGLLVYSADGTIRFANQRLGLMTGYPTEAMEGASIQHLFDLEDHPRLQQLLGGAASVQTTSLDMRLRCADGSLLPVVAIQAGQQVARETGEFERVMVLTNLSDLRAREEALTKQTHRLSALNRASQVIASTLSLDRTIRAILEEIISVLEAHNASLLLLLPGGRELSFHSAIGPGSELLRDIRVPISEGIAGQAVRERRPIIVPDAYQDEHFYPQVDALTGIRTGSIAAAPLIVDDEVLGVVEAINKAQGTFDRDDLNILEGLARSAAIAIRNARLYDEAKRHVSELTVLLQVSEATSSTLAIEQVQEAVARQMIDALGGQWCAICAWDRLQQTLQHLAEVTDLFWPADQRDCIDLALLPQASMVVANGEPIISAGGEPIDEPPAAGFASRIALPVAIDGRVVGIAELYRGPDQRPALARDLERCHAALAEWARASGAGDWTEIEHVRRLGTALLEAADAVRCTLFAYLPEEQALARLYRCGRVVWPLEQGPVFGLDTGSLRHLALVERTPTTGRLEPESLSPSDRLAFPLLGGVVLLVPLVAHGESLGLIALIDTHPERVFSDEDLSLARGIGNGVASALENARLYSALLRRAAQLEAAYNDLQEADRLKDEWIQSVSHELRTPLTSISGYIELLLEQDLGPLTDQQRDALQIIREKSETLTRLVEDILTIQRMEREKLRREKISLREVAEQAITAIQPLAAHAGIEVVAEFEDSPFEMAGDSDLLRQAFGHLLSNAVKFSASGTQVIVRLEDLGAGIRAEVIDQGIGIAPEEHDKIWRRFYQVDGGITRSYSGTGLGLAIVKQVAEKHEGHVSVTSAIGRGSCFTMLLPKAMAAES